MLVCACECVSEDSVVMCTTSERTGVIVCAGSLIKLEFGVKATVRERIQDFATLLDNCRAVGFV